MSEDDSTPADPNATESRRSWLERISSALSGEPTTREDLVELLRDAQADGLIAADTLRMMEGAIAVSDLTVGDVMIPRAQMVALPADATFLDLMKLVVESGHSRFPVHGEDKDEILGILLAKDLLRGVVADNGPRQRARAAAPGGADPRIQAPQRAAARVPPVAQPHGDRDRRARRRRRPGHDRGRARADRRRDRRRARRRRGSERADRARRPTASSWSMR